MATKRDLARRIFRMLSRKDVVWTKIRDGEYKGGGIKTVMEVYEIRAGKFKPIVVTVTPYYPFTESGEDVTFDPKRVGEVKPMGKYSISSRSDFPCVWLNGNRTGTYKRERFGEMNNLRWEEGWAVEGGIVESEEDRG